MILENGLSTADMLVGEPQAFDVCTISPIIVLLSLTRHYPFLMSC